MNKSLLLPAFALFLHLANAQNTIHVNVCTKLWKANEPITATTITATVTAPGFTTETTTIPLSITESCAAFDFNTSQYPANAKFAFSADKPQDDPLNGLTALDFVLISQHLLGAQILPPFAIIAGESNNSYSLTTFDIVESRKVLLGIYSSLPNAPIWRFFPDYWLPFQNPTNPFMGFSGSTSLNLTQMQALNGGTIVLIGTKTGDVNGDVNTMHAILGPGTDSFALKLPNVMLQAGVPAIIPITLQGNTSISGLQVEISGIPGAIALDTLTVDPQFNQYFGVHSTDPAQKSLLRVLFLDAQHTLTGSPVMYLHLTPNTSMALKDAVQIHASNFTSMAAGDDNQVYRLYLDFANTVGTHNPATENVQFVSASPNPFGAEAQIQIALAQSETVLLEVMDVSGKVLNSSKSTLAAGIHNLAIPGALLPNDAVILYRVTAGQSVATGKLLHRQ